MKEFRYVIRDPQGMHARPAGELVSLAKKFSSRILVTRLKDAEGNIVQKTEKSAAKITADAGKIFALMGLGIRQGEEILVQAEGEDEKEAEEAIREFLTKNL